MAMKTKTRNTIGKILVWGGIIDLVFILFLDLTNKDIILSSISSPGVPPFSFNGIFLSAGIFALLIGGLWGMRRK